MSQKNRISLMHWGVGSLAITSIFALSTLIPLLEISWPNTIPCLIMKWHFLNLELSSFLYIVGELTLSDEDIGWMYPCRWRNYPWKSLKIVPPYRKTDWACIIGMLRERCRIQRVCVSKQGSEWTSERGLLLVLYSNWDLIVPWVTIHKIVVLVIS